MLAIIGYALLTVAALALGWCAVGMSHRKRYGEPLDRGR